MVVESSLPNQIECILRIRSLSEDNILCWWKQSIWPYIFNTQSLRKSSVLGFYVPRHLDCLKQTNSNLNNLSTVKKSLYTLTLRGIIYSKLPDSYEKFLPARIYLGCVYAKPVEAKISSFQTWLEQNGLSLRPCLFSINAFQNARFKTGCVYLSDWVCQNQAFKRG